MSHVKWTVALLSILALVVSLAPAYAGGGAGCDAAKGAKAAKTADGGHDGNGRAAKAEKLAAKGWLGIDTRKDEASGAVIVKSVAQGSPAEAAGFRTGDVLVSLNGIALTAENKESLKKAKSQLGVGKAVSYVVQRGEAKQQLTATLAPVPQDVLAQWLAEEEQQTRQAAAVAAAKGNR